jgi:hypothetical protein
MDNRLKAYIQASRRLASNAIAADRKGRGSSHHFRAIEGVAKSLPAPVQNVPYANLTARLGFQHQSSDKFNSVATKGFAQIGLRYL